MLSPYPLTTIISLSLITLFYLFILLFQKKQSFKLCLDKYFFQIKFLILFFHLFTAFALNLAKGEVSDVALFASAGYCLWHKIDIYWLDATHGTYPFLPFTIYPYTLFWLISEKFPFLTFSFLVKLVLIPALFLTARLLGKVLTSDGVKKQKANLVQLLFLTNPVLFLAITFHGQADIALIYFFVLSVYYLKPKKELKMAGDAWRGTAAEKTPRRWPNACPPAPLAADHGRRGLLRGGGEKERLILAGIFMAISLMIKSWSVIFLPLIFWQIKSLKKKIIYFSTIFLTIFSFVLLYRNLVHSSLHRIFSAFVLHPGGASGYWGTTGLLALLSPFITTKLLMEFLTAHKILIIIIGWLAGLVFFVKKPLTIFQGTLLFLLIFYCLTAGWGLQYSAWIIPFAFLVKDWQEANIYSLLTLPYLSLAYLSITAGWQGEPLNRMIVFLALFSWLYSLFWLLRLTTFGVKTSTKMKNQKLKTQTQIF